MIEPVRLRLDDVDQAGLEREERDDQLGDVAERRVEDAADLRPGDRAEPLRGLADQPGEPEDRERRQAEDDASARGRDERPSAAIVAIAEGDDDERERAREAATGRRGSGRRPRGPARRSLMRLGPRRAAGGGMPVAAATWRAASPRAVPAATSRSTSASAAVDRVGVRRLRRLPGSWSRRDLADDDRELAAERQLARSVPGPPARRAAPGRSPRGASSARGRSAAGSLAAAGGREVRERGRDPARRLVQHRAPRVGRDPGEPLPPLATRARQEPLERPARPGDARTRRSPPAPPTRPGSGRPSPPSAAHAATSSPPGSLIAGRPGVGHEREVRAGPQVLEQLPLAARAAPGVVARRPRRDPVPVEQPPASSACPRPRSAAPTARTSSARSVTSARLPIGVATT